MFVPGAGDDVVVGGSGSDVLEATGELNFTLSNSQLVGLGTDVLTSIEVARLTGGDGANVITTSAFSGATLIDAGAGNDTVTSGPGNDVLTGGIGADTFDNDDADNASRVTDVSDSVIANVFASPFPSWLDVI